MKKLLNTPWFSGLLALVAIAVVGQSFWSPGPKTPSASLATDATDPESSSSLALSIPEALAALQIPPSLRDPFAPRNAEPAPVGLLAIKPPEEIRTTFLLSAIWRQDSASLALVNGSIQTAGSQLGPIQIESIQADGIWVTHHKGRTFVALGAPFTLSTPPVSATPPARSGG